MLFSRFSETFSTPVRSQGMWFGKFGITTNLESVYSNNVGWQIRIWYSISTDIIVYAKQVLVTDQDVGGSVLHMSSFLLNKLDISAKQYPDGDDRYDDLVLH
jgi:hypothetical protein